MQDLSEEEARLLPRQRQIIKPTGQIKPLGYLKAHAAEIVRTLGDRREPLITTQNGEPKAIMQDIKSYEQKAVSPKTRYPVAGGLWRQRAAEDSQGRISVLTFSSSSRLTDRITLESLSGADPPDVRM
jgi:hypothetical protein